MMERKQATVKRAFPFKISFLDASVGIFVMMMICINIQKFSVARKRFFLINGQCNKLIDGRIYYIQKHAHLLSEMGGNINRCFSGAASFCIEMAKLSVRLVR